MNIETVPIKNLSQDSANARKHNPRNLEAIKASLRRFGQQKPIVVDSKNIVRAGNGTFQAAQALGWTEIKIVHSDLPPSELTAYAIADNRTAELAEWDGQVLAKLMADEDLGDLGFESDELEKLFSQDSDPDRPVLSLDEKFEVVVECQDEPQQKQVFDRLTNEGYPCRLFTL
jgi:ParB family transcriptional regulator, chromosome partitioning protein